MTQEFGFTLHKTDGLARRGTVHTGRGDIRTPAFMPVGTVGTVKGLYLNQVKETGADIILGNTYHLMLRPGAEQVAKLGGLHKFIGWEGPILTDSGGFQIMSLSKIRKIKETGATFQSHIDGRKYELTPERAMEIQRLLGSDIQMQLDQCLEFPHSEKDAEKAMELSLRWGARSRTAFGSQSGRGNFGIVQGGTNERLRLKSADGLRQIGFEGYAIGGLAVGEGQQLMLQTKLKALPSYGSYFQLYSYAGISNETENDFAIRLTKEYGVTGIPVSVFYKQETNNKVLRFFFGKTKTQHFIIGFVFIKNRNRYGRYAIFFGKPYGKITFILIAYIIILIQLKITDRKSVV